MVQFDSEDSISIKVKNISEAYDIWNQLGDLNRGTALTQVGEYLLENKIKLAELIVDSMGKLNSEAETEIEKCAWVCEWYSEHANQWLDQQNIETDAKSTSIHFESLGCILGILPWNFPFWQAFRFMIPNLIAGNTVLIKHDPKMSEIAKVIVKIFEEVGVPKGVVQYAHVANENVKGLIESPEIKGVAFTGGSTAGKIVASQAGAFLKPVVLELGGNDPFIVLNDTRLNTTIDHALKSRYGNAGQVCIAAKRFIVQSEVYEDFLEDFINESQLFLPGDPKDKMTSLAPLVSEDAAQRLQSQVDELKAKGFERVYGEDWIQQNKCKFSPQIFVAKEGLFYDEELFGPVSIIYRANDENEIVELANKSKYGLSASIWSVDEDRAKRIANQINAGSVFINENSKSDPRLPLGGKGYSGFGRELGEMGIRAFLNCKTLWLRSQ